MLTALDGLLTSIIFFVMITRLVKQGDTKNIKSLATLAIVIASMYGFLILINEFGALARGCIGAIAMVLLAAITSCAISYFTYKEVHEKDWTSAKTYIDLNLVSTIISIVVIAFGLLLGLTRGGMCIGAMLSIVAFIVTAVLLGVAAKKIKAKDETSAKLMIIVSMIFAGLSGLTFIFDFI